MTMELIKKVRQITGAGMSDVKKALDEASGDKTKAIEVLRKAGAKLAAKKSERETKEGVIALAQDKDKLAVVELACETDFVAKNEDFITSAEAMAKELLAKGKDSFESWATGHIQNELIVKIGENLKLGKFDVIEGSTLGVYLHSNKKVAAVVSLKKGSEELAKDIAMHVAAMAPIYLSPEDVPTEVLDKEKEIYAEQLKKGDKPEAMLAKISEGKVNKFYTEVCLLKQPYVKDDKQSIEKLLTDSQAAIDNFYYFSL